MNQIWVIVLTLSWMVALWECVGNEFEHIEMFFRWLKGSRKIYYLSDFSGYNEAFATSQKMSTHIDISKGFWRWRSIVYGPNPNYWEIVRERTSNGRGVVELRDTLGVNLEDTLRLVNRYPSLQAMLDRIAKLEKDLQIAQQSRLEWGAGIVAILQIIYADRQRYRSKPAANIRACLENLLKVAKFVGEPEPTEELILKRRNMFKEFIVKE